MAYLNALAARLGPKGLITDPAALAPRLTEWRGRYTGQTPALALPANLDEVVDLVKICVTHGVSLTPQGGNTGLVGGQIPQGEVLVGMTRMNAIRSVNATDDALTVEAGVVLTAVHEAAGGADRHFPLSLGSQGSATVGGLISTNAGGVHVVRYGMMRDLVLGLEAVLPDGSVLNGLKSLRKDNTGYDLKQLLIGAEGTLGLVTAATLRLFPKPAGHVVAMAALQGADQALALLHLIKQRTGALAAFELMNRLSVDLAVRHVPGVRDPFRLATAYLALIELESAAPGLEDLAEDALGEALETGLVVDAALARSDAAVKDFWKLRESLPAGHRPEGAQANHDVSVPVSLVPYFLAEAAARVESLCPGAKIVAFGHAGDGNIHYSALQPPAMDPAAFPAAAITDAVHELVVGLGGSISAEHGIGVSRRADFHRFKPPAQIAAMRAIKAALDPKGIMNPRVLL
jgi:FAD/FMN-containing dehydrogenase